MIEFLLFPVCMKMYVQITSNIIVMCTDFSGKQFIVDLFLVTFEMCVCVCVVVVVVVVLLLLQHKYTSTQVPAT